MGRSVNHRDKGLVDYQDRRSVDRRGMGRLVDHRVVGRSVDHCVEKKVNRPPSGKKVSLPSRGRKVGHLVEGSRPLGGRMVNMPPSVRKTGRPPRRRKFSQPPGGRKVHRLASQPITSVDRANRPVSLSTWHNEDWEQKHSTIPSDGAPEDLRGSTEVDGPVGSSLARMDARRPNMWCLASTTTLLAQIPDPDTIAVLSAFSLPLYRR
nr:hypothetical protein Iba_chr08dCG9450 [Ipomoea batatas]